METYNQRYLETEVSKLSKCFKLLGLNGINVNTVYSRLTDLGSCNSLEDILKDFKLSVSKQPGAELRVVLELEKLLEYKQYCQWFLNKDSHFLKLPYNASILLSNIVLNQLPNFEIVDRNVYEIITLLIDDDSKLFSDNDKARLEKYVNVLVNEKVINAAAGLIESQLLVCITTVRGVDMNEIENNLKQASAKLKEKLQSITVSKQKAF